MTGTRGLERAKETEAAGALEWRCGEGVGGETHCLSRHVTYQPLPTLQAWAGSCEVPFPQSAQPISWKTPGKQMLAD